MNKIFIIVLLCLATMAQAQAEKGKWTFIPMAGANLIVSEPLDYEIGVTAGRLAGDRQGSGVIRSVLFFGTLPHEYIDGKQ